jgi:hypothetical protein
VYLPLGWEILSGSFLLAATGASGRSGTGLKV